MFLGDTAELVDQRLTMNKLAPTTSRATVARPSYLAIKEGQTKVHQRKGDCDSIGAKEIEGS